MKNKNKKQKTKNNKPFLENSSSRGDRNKKTPSNFSSKAPAFKGEVQIPSHWRIVVGHHAIQEVLKVRPKSIRRAYIRSDWEASEELKKLNQWLIREGISAEIRSPQSLEKMGASHQGLVIYSDKLPEFDLDDLCQRSQSIIVGLDGIEDPHNLGAILRTAWLTGVSGVIIPSHRAVSLTGTVHKVACGGVEHVPILSINNFSTVIERLKENGYWVYGLSPRGKVSLFNLKLPSKVVWIIGAEDKGMRVTTERLCDDLVVIPQVTQGASFNASVASAMTLTETIRQQMHHQFQK